MTKLAIAIRHVHFEDCGVLGDVLAERGFTVDYVDAGSAALEAVDVASADLLVGLGGPVSVYDQALYPWIRRELALFEQAIQLRKPVIGICLGAQMLASALGARVYPGPVKELGWAPLQLTAEGKASIIAPLGEPGVSMLHWHGDTFDLPPGTRLLASTQAVKNQVFQFGTQIIAFQCHPEVQAEAIESWLIGHAAEIAGTRGVSLAQLRNDSARLGPALRQRARLMFSAWLDSVEL